MCSVFKSVHCIKVYNGDKNNSSRENFVIYLFSNVPKFFDLWNCLISFVNLTRDQNNIHEQRCQTLEIIESWTVAKFEMSPKISCETVGFGLPLCPRPEVKLQCPAVVSGIMSHLVTRHSQKIQINLLHIKWCYFKGFSIPFKKRSHPLHRNAKIEKVDCKMWLQIVTKYLQYVYSSGLLYFLRNMFISRTTGNTGKYQEIWEILGNTECQKMDS